MKIEIIFIANILIIKSTLSIEASGIETDKIWRDYKKKFSNFKFIILSLMKFKD
jgi:hypothetical protein